MTTIAYMGWLGHNNLGDEACFCGIAKHLPIQTAITCWDIGPWPYESLPDLSIVGGGTLLDLGFDTRAKSLLALQQRGVPTIFWGTGVLPHTGVIHPQVQRLLENSLFVGVRGPRSISLLNAGGYTSAVQVGDPALLLSTPNTTLGKTSKTVALNIGDARGRMLGSEQFVVEQAQMLAQTLVARGYEVILFSMWPSDEKYLGKLSFSEKIRLRKFNPSVLDLMNFFKNCYCVIGMKLHAIVLSAAACVPFISIAYRDKCIDFADSIGLKRWAIPSDDAKLAHRIDSMFTALPEYYDVITARMQEYIYKYRAQHSEIARIAWHALFGDELKIEQTYKGCADD